MRVGTAIKTWTIRNAGTVPWVHRRLERQGPITGPGLITSLRFLDMPDADPGQMITIVTGLKTPGYDCASIAYFKQIAAEGHICFPDNYPVGARRSGARPRPETRRARPPRVAESLCSSPLRCRAVIRRHPASRLRGDSPR